MQFVCVYTQLCPTLCDPVALWGPLSVGFTRQEYWSGLLFPSPGDFPDPRIEPPSLMYPALVGGFFTTEPTGEPYTYCSAKHTPSGRLFE